MPPPGMEQATPCFPACRSNSDIETVNMLLIFYTILYATINQHVWQCMYESDFC